MSNETKQDVFEGLLEQYKDTDDELIAERNPIDWAPQQSKQAYKIFLFKNRYNAALPDDLPVIPERISKIIRITKSVKMDITQALIYLRSEFNSYTDWSLSDNNSETFARAWLLEAWRIEETGEIVKLEEEK